MKYETLFGDGATVVYCRVSPIPKHAIECKMALGHDRLDSVVLEMQIEPQFGKEGNVV